MIGHHETATGSSAVRRVILLLAVAAVVVAMMAASAMPAYAAGRGKDVSFRHACANNNNHPAICQ